MVIEHFILALIVFMLIASLIAAEANDLLSAVICLGAAGFALSVIDLLLGAPDLAITQVVVEVISLVLLVRVVLRRDDTSTIEPRDTLRTAVVLVLAGILLVVVFVAAGGTSGDGTIPPFGSPLFADPAGRTPEPVSTAYLARSAEQTGAANAVMAVLLDYRAYDTLGEATVIFVSILGAYAILRQVGRRKGEHTL